MSNRRILLISIVTVIFALSVATLMVMIRMEISTTLDGVIDARIKHSNELISGIQSIETEPTPEKVTPDVPYEELPKNQLLLTPEEIEQERARLQREGAILQEQATEVNTEASNMSYNNNNKQQTSDYPPNSNSSVNTNQRRQISMPTFTHKVKANTHIPIATNSGLNPQKLSQLESVSKSLIGVPYVWGGTNPKKGMDCSGYTQYVMKQLGYNIPRVSKDQSKYGTLVSRKSLLPGDLLFFDTTNPRDKNDIKTPTQELQHAYEVENGYKPVTVSHVGIYLGNGVMIHASSGDGIITYADLSSNYYKNRFINARRVIL